MKTVNLIINPINLNSSKMGRIDSARVDATIEKDIAAQQANDDLETMQDVARFVQRVWKRLGLSQAKFAKLTSVSLDTIRNWEQSKRSPTDVAIALLKILDKLPELALAALS
jgi:putative transcriptional regulator